MLLLPSREALLYKALVSALGVAFQRLLAFLLSIIAACTSWGTRCRRVERRCDKQVVTGTKSRNLQNAVKRQPVVINRAALAEDLAPVNTS